MHWGKDCKARNAVMKTEAAVRCNGMRRCACHMSRITGVESSVSGFVAWVLIGMCGAQAMEAGVMNERTRARASHFDEHAY